MKLIEKLATEIEDKIDLKISKFGGPTYYGRAMYEAGFRKARDLSVQTAINYPNDIDVKPFGFCNVCGGGPEVAKQIEKLGEQEVE